MSGQLQMITDAQCLLQKKIGMTHAICALIDRYKVSAKDAEQAVEQARYLLRLHRT